MITTPADKFSPIGFGFAVLKGVVAGLMPGGTGGFAAGIVVDVGNDSLDDIIKDWSILRFLHV